MYIVYKEQLEGHINLECLSINLSESARCVKRKKLNSIRYKTTDFGAAAFEDIALFLTGGSSYFERNRRMVMRYTIMSDKWDIDLPLMNE